MSSISGNSTHAKTLYKRHDINVKSKLNTNVSGQDTVTVFSFFLLTEYSYEETLQALLYLFI